MTQGGGELSPIINADAGQMNAVTGAQALAENADRFGLVWKMRPATITSGVNPTLIELILDGDETPVNAYSLVGPLALGARVMTMVVPPSGVYVTGYAGGQVRANSPLLRLTGPVGVQMVTSTSYVDLTGGLMSGFVKQADYTDLRVDIRSGGYALTSPASFSLRYGVSILGNDYDVNSMHFNEINVHDGWSGIQDIESIPAGTYDIQIRVRVTVALKTAGIDSQDEIHMTVTEMF